MKVKLAYDQTLETKAYIVIRDGEIIDVRLDALDYNDAPGVLIIPIDCTGEIIIDLNKGGASV